MKKNNLKMIIIISILILSCILIYVGQFLCNQKKTSTEVKGSNRGVVASQNVIKNSLPVEYKHISTTINGKEQKIFTVEFNPQDRRIAFQPVLSYDNIFGFESLSEISKRTVAYAAINGGFFYEFGDPVGMVVINGKIYMSSGGYGPVLIVDKSGARFDKIISNISFTKDGDITHINKINSNGKDGNIVLYTSEYGTTNRAEIKNTSINIEGNIVTSITESKKEVAIKKNNYLISFYGRSAVIPKKLGITVGTKVEIDIKPRIDNNYNAYECGSMLVRNGRTVVSDHDRWVGTLENRDPRTAIGIKENGNIIMVVVDGRQPGYSSGFTGRELASFLIQIGVKDAAMLDGGASSQMLIEGKLVNRPSANGKERPVAGALIVKVKGN